MKENTDSHTLDGPVYTLTPGAVLHWLKDRLGQDSQNTWLCKSSDSKPPKREWRGAADRIQPRDWNSSHRGAGLVSGCGIMCVRIPFLPLSAWFPAGWFRLCARRAGFHPIEWPGAEQFRIMMGLNRGKSIQICLFWTAAQKRFMPWKKKDKHLKNKVPLLSSDTSCSNILRKGRLITRYDFSQPSLWH